MIWVIAIISVLSICVILFAVYLDARNRLYRQGISTKNGDSMDIKRINTITKEILQVIEYHEATLGEARLILSQAKSLIDSDILRVGNYFDTK